MLMEKSANVTGWETLKRLVERVNDTRMVFRDGLPDRELLVLSADLHMFAGVDCTDFLGIPFDDEDVNERTQHTDFRLVRSAKLWSSRTGTCDCCETCFYVHHHSPSQLPEDKALSPVPQCIRSRSTDGSQRTQSGTTLLGCVLGGRRILLQIGTVFENDTEPSNMWSLFVTRGNWRCRISDDL